MKFIRPNTAQRQSANWLQGSTLLHTVAICMLIGMVLGAMVLLNGYAMLETKAQYFKELARDNLESGKNLVLYGKAPVPGHYEGMLFESPIDSYQVDVEAWGVYGLMHAKGVHGQARAVRSFLFGAQPEGLFDAQLFLEDRGRPLSMAGQAQLKGELYLPESGLRRGYVGREGFTGKHLHEGEVKMSRGQSLDFSSIWTKAIREEVWQFAKQGVGGSWQPQYGGQVEADWAGEGLRLSSGGSLRLDHVLVKGKVLLLADELQIGPEAKLDGAICIARRIFIEPGFEGRGQFYGLEYVLVDSAVHLRYPSAVVLCSGNTLDALELRNTAVVEGLVWSDGSMVLDEIHDMGMTTIAKGAEVYGHVVVRDNLNLQGKVHGHVLAGSFRHQNAQAVYDNVLYNGGLGREGLAKTYAMPLLAGKIQNYQEIEGL